MTRFRESEGGNFRHLIDFTTGLKPGARKAIAALSRNRNLNSDAAQISIRIVWTHV